MDVQSPNERKKHAELFTEKLVCMKITLFVDNVLFPKTCTELW